MKKSRYYFIFVFVFSIMIINPLILNVYGASAYSVTPYSQYLIINGTNITNFTGIEVSGIKTGNIYYYLLDVNGWVDNLVYNQRYTVVVPMCVQGEATTLQKESNRSAIVLEQSSRIQPTSIKCQMGTGTGNPTAYINLFMFDIRNNSTDGPIDRYFSISARAFFNELDINGLPKDKSLSKSYFRPMGMVVTDEMINYENNFVIWKLLIDALNNTSNADEFNELIEIQNQLLDELQSSSLKAQEQIEILENLLNQNAEMSDLTQEQNTLIQEQNTLIQEQIDFQNDTSITESESEAGGFFDSFVADKTGLSGIVAMPLMIIDNLISYKGNMAQLVLPLPFINTSLTIPNMYTVFNNAFPEFVTLYQIVTDGVISYMVLKGLFTKVMALQSPSDDKVDMLDL